MDKKSNIEDFEENTCDGLRDMTRQRQCQVPCASVSNNDNRKSRKTNELKQLNPSIDIHILLEHCIFPILEHKDTHKFMFIIGKSRMYDERQLTGEKNR